MEFGVGVAKALTDFISMYGEEVEVDSIDVTGSLDAWHDTDVAWTTSTITVLLGEVHRNDSWLKTGLLETGDMTMTVKTANSVKVRDRVRHNSITYEVVDIRTNRLQNGTVNTVAALKRHSDN